MLDALFMNEHFLETKIWEEGQHSWEKQKSLPRPYCGITGMLCTRLSAELVGAVEVMLLRSRRKHNTA